MKGWVTVDPKKAIEVVEQYGRLKVLDDRELVVEVETIGDFQRLQEALHKNFGHEMDVELIRKSD